jgi:uncharacterized protein YndB with AHSA1/START domain
MLARKCSDSANAAYGLGEINLQWMNMKLSRQRDLMYETTVKGDLATVWRAWTTAEGLCEFFSKQAEVELRIGGLYELAFAPNAPVGQRAWPHVLDAMRTTLEQ